MIRPLLPCLLALCCACSPGPEGTRGSGMVLTSDGRMISNTDVNERAETVRHLVGDLNQAIAPDWTSAVVIDELPTWVAGSSDGDGEWRWPRITALITLTPTGSGDLPLAPETLRAAVEDYLVKKSKAVTVTITSQERKAASQAPEAIARTPGAAAPRTYTVQAGDTLADVSTVCLGAPERWREIVAANPGLDPAKLVPGQVLTIPASSPAAP